MPDDKIHNIIRFGVMCDGTLLQKWQKFAITNILLNKNTKLCLLIVNKRQHNKLQPEKAKPILWAAYSRLTKLFDRGAAKFTETIDLFNGIPRLYPTIAKTGRFSEYYSEKDILDIKQFELDFILSFGVGIIRGKVLSAARYGIWSFHYGDEQKYRGGPEGFWEVYNREAITGAVLQRLTDKLSGGVVLRRGYFKTKTSCKSNKDQMLMTSARWPAHVCIDILNGSYDGLMADQSKTQAPITKAPTNCHFLQYMANSILGRINALKKHFYTDYWNIGIVNNNVQNLSDDALSIGVNWYPRPQPTRFMADPFGYLANDKLFILYEDFPFENIRGNISLVSYENNQFLAPQVVIDEPVHMSYPYIIYDGDQLFCLPETHQFKKIVLYQAVKFPDKWEKIKVLIDDFPGVDSTVIQYQGIWWLFTSREDEGPHNLYIYYSDKLLGNWQPHPKNPVKTDVRSARPAGTPFFRNHTLFRPAQDFSIISQGRIVINEVKTLNTSNFEEIPCTTINPISSSPFPDKIHTISQAGNYTIIDGCRRLCIFNDRHVLKFRIKYFTRRILDKIFPKLRHVNK